MGKSIPTHLRPFVKTKSAPLFMGLNALRALSIVALLLVIAFNLVTISDDAKAIKAARHPASSTTTSNASSASASPSAPPAAATASDGPKVLFVTVTPTSTAAGQVVTLYVREDPAPAPVESSAPAKSSCVRKAPQAEPEPEWEYAWVDEPSNADSYTAPANAKMLAASSMDNSPNVTVNDYCNYIPSSTVPLQTAGAFWSILNRLFLVFEALLLILAEIGFPKRIFQEYLPMLGPAYGLGTLGVLQALIASSVLSHHSALFPQIAAWLLFVVAVGNVLAGIFLRQKAKAQRALFKWEDTEEEDVFPVGGGGGGGEKAKAPIQLAYDWSADYAARLRGGDCDAGASAPEHTTTQRNPSTASSSSLYSSTVHSQYGNGAEPKVIPGARFGGFSFGRQADLERDAHPKISRPFEIVRPR